MLLAPFRPASGTKTRLRATIVFRQLQLFLMRLLALLLVLSGPTTGTKISRYREQRTALGLDGKVPTTPTLDNYGRRRLRLQSDEHLSIAIARPFSIGQEKALVDSFADWSTFPLSEHDCQNYE